MHLNTLTEKQINIEPVKLLSLVCRCLFFQKKARANVALDFDCTPSHNVMTFRKVLLWMRYFNPQFLKESHEIRYSCHLKTFIVIKVFSSFSKEDGSV